MGTRILTVEDDERIRTAVRLALEDEGWEVEEADTGEEALQAEAAGRCRVGGRHGVFFSIESSGCRQKVRLLDMAR